jgi:DNA polymerase V
MPPCPALLDPPPLPLPLATSSVACGFPSPAEDHREEALDLNRLLVRRPAATFFMRASGDSMTGAGIADGDLLVVDRSRTPRDGDPVIAVVDGELACKTYRTGPAGPRLRAENPRWTGDFVPPGREFEVWGVVTAVVRELARHG